MTTKFARAEHGIPVVDNSATRDALYPAPEINQRVHNLQTAFIERWNGLAWIQEIPLPAASTLDVFPSVSDAVARNTQFPSGSTAIGTVVQNIAARRLERLRADRNYEELTATPTGHVNSDSFALGGWYDANGIKQFHNGLVNWLTAADITAGQPLWRGKYFAYADTRDDVLLNEMLLEAYAPSTAKGGASDIVWSAGAGRPCWIQGIVWLTARAMFAADISGADIRGMSPLATEIRCITRDTSNFMTDGFTGSIMENLAFTRSGDRLDNGVSLSPGSHLSHSYKPMIDLACFGSFGVTAPTIGQASDMTVYTVTGSAMPSIQFPGAGWALNQWIGQYVVIIDDNLNAQAIGQVRRIVENTTDTLYIAGRWDWIPSANAIFILAPTAYGWGNWHNATRMSWFYGTKAMPVMTGQILRRFTYQNSNTVTKGTVQGSSASTQLNGSQWTWNIDINAWDNGTPRPGYNAGDAGSHLLGANARAGEPDNPPYHPLANFTIGGTLYTGAGTIVANDDAWVSVSGAPFGADNSKVGMRVRTIAANGGIASATVTVNEAGGVVTVGGGLGRVAGDLVEMRVIVLTGAFAGQIRWVKANGATVAGATTITLDTVVGLTVGDTIQVLDALVLGQCLVVTQNTGSNKLWTTWSNGDLNLFWFWRKRPKVGDQIQLLGKYSNQLIQGNLFHKVNANGGGFADMAWALARTGTQSMGSECEWHGCGAFANRVGLYADGFNVLDLNWYGGGAGANIHTFYVPRGSMNIHGVGFGTGNFGNQVGAHVYYGGASRSHVSLSSLYVEDFMLVSAGAPITLTHCSTFGSILGVTTLNRTWTPGELWQPQGTVAIGGQTFKTSKGRQFMCVEVLGTGSTAGLAEPATLAENGIEPLVEISNAGNGARFVRLDFAAVVGGPNMTIIGGIYCLGQIDVIGDLVIQGAVVSRPDWNGSNTLNSSESGVGSLRGTVTCRPSIVDPNQSLNALGHTALVTPFFANAYLHPYPTYLSGPLEWIIGLAGDFKTLSLLAFRGDEIGMTANDRLLALLGGGNGTFGSDQGAPPPIFGGMPRQGGNDIAGYDTRIGGGQGTGSGVSGGVELLVAPAGGSGGAINPLVRAVYVDPLKRLIQSGGYAAGTAAATNVANAGTYTPDAAAKQTHRINAQGATLTVANPTNLVDGARVMLDIANSSGGASACTLGTKYLGTFPMPATGKRRTQVYEYDLAADKLVPIGAQSGDL